MKTSKTSFSVLLLLFLLLILSLGLAIDINSNLFGTYLNAKSVSDSSEVQIVVVRLDYTTFDIIGYYELSQTSNDSPPDQTFWLDINNIYYWDFYNRDAGWLIIFSKFATGEEILRAGHTRNGGSFDIPPDSLMKSEFVIGNNNVLPDKVINIIFRGTISPDSAWIKVWETDILEEISNAGAYDVYVFSHSYGKMYSPSEWFVIAHENHLPIGIDDELYTPLKNYELYQNYPNPFNPVTKINYAIPVDSDVSLILYNLRGHEVARLVDSKRIAGNHSISWNASNVASGIYFYRLQIGDFVQTRKMVLLK